MQSRGEESRLNNSYVRRESISLQSSLKEKMDLRKFTRKALVKNKWLSLLEDKYVLPNGAECTYYHAQQNDAVMAIAVEVLNSVATTYIVNQYRHPIGKSIWQFPLGGFDPETQDPLAAARVELSEEIGVSVGEIRNMGSFYANPGFSNQKIHVCISGDITDRYEPRLEESEFGLISKSIPVSDIPGMIEAGEMGDAWGITGLHYINRYLKLHRKK